MKMVNPLWDFFQIPFNKMESNACPKQMKNQETLVSKIGKWQNGYSLSGEAWSSSWFQSSREYTPWYIRFLLHINGSLMAILSTKPVC